MRLLLMKLLLRLALNCIAAICIAETGVSASEIARRPPLIQTLADGSNVLTLPLDAAANKTTKVNFIEYMNPDCSFKAYSTVTVVKQAQHGTLSVRKAVEIPVDPKYGHKAECYRKPVQGMLLEYKPKPGYHGPDEFAYEFPAQDASGKKIQHVRMVTVR